MNTESRMADEILALVKEQCGSATVRRFLSDQRKVHAMERRLIGSRKKPSKNSPQVNQTRMKGEAYDHLLTVCKRELDDYAYEELLLAIGDIFKSHGAYEEARQIYAETMKRAEQAKHIEYVAEALLRRGEVYSYLGRWIQSNGDLGRCRQLFWKTGDQDALARVENLLGTNYAEQGEMERAKECFSRALRKAGRKKDRILSAVIAMNLGIVQNILGNRDEATNYVRQAHTVFEILGDRMRIGEARHNLGMIALSRGALEDALKEFHRCLEVSMQIDSPRLLGLAKLGKANVLFRLKDPPLALTFCNQADEHFCQIGDRLSLADCYKLKGMILKEMKEFALAEMHFQSSMRINEEYSNLLNMGETAYELGLLQQDRKQHQRARASFELASDYFRRIGARRDLDRASKALNDS